MSNSSKGLLKFITCGSVDDGKSTLIGHILYNSKLIYADQEQALILDSQVGSCGGKIDYSLLLDGRGRTGYNNRCCLSLFFNV